MNCTPKNTNEQKTKETTENREIIMDRSDTTIKYGGRGSAPLYGENNNQGDQGTEGVGFFGIPKSSWCNNKQAPPTAQEIANQAYEATMVGEGNEKFSISMIGADHVTERPAHFNKLQEALPLVSKGIILDLKTYRASKGRIPMWVEPISTLDPDVLAYIGLLCMFNSVLKDTTVTNTVLTIGTMIEQELLKLELLEDDKQRRQVELQEAKEAGVKPQPNRPQNARVIKQVMESNSGYAQRVKSLRIIAKKNGFTSVNFGTYKNTAEQLVIETRRAHLASAVTSAVLKYCDVFNKEHVKVKAKRSRSHYAFTDEAQAALDETEEYLSWMQPVLKPMLCPPTPWTSFDTGCYKDPFLASKNKLVRGVTRAQQSAIEHQLSEGTPNYLRAINLLQATPLAINEGMLEVVQWCWDEQKSLGKFPTTKLPPRPKLPENYRDSMMQDEISARKADIRRHFKLERQVKGSAAVMRQDLQVAHELAVHDEFYIGWNMDWRSRMYMLTPFSYHKDEHIKSLFLYRNGYRVEGNDAYFLKVHLANCGDFDKISKAPLDHRVKWVDDNHDQLLACARDYKEGYGDWSRADKPFTFLAACIEYARYIEEGDNFVGYVPKSLDGSNSGVQHYSALTLAEKEGSYVNLTPSPTVQDIYQLNAGRMVSILEGMRKEGVIDQRWSSEAQKEKAAQPYSPGKPYSRTKAQLARVFLKFGVTRKLMKRPCMTWPYSSKALGMADQFVEDLMKPLQRLVAYGDIARHPIADTEPGQFEAARFLGQVSYDCITETLPTISKAMNYLQAMALTVSKENKALAWTTPAGFPAFQDYRSRKPKPVQIMLYDRTAGKRVRTKCHIEYDTDKSSSKRMQNGVSPNIVHSFDAAHMQNTICHMADLGYTDYFMIHDSFSVSGDTRDLFDGVRETFVDQYSGDCLLGRLEEEVRQRLDDPETPFLDQEGVEHKRPSKGTLDINGVLESEFCFA